MANRDLTYLISFDAESGGLDGASEEIDRITKALDDIDSSAVDIDVDSRELEDATDEVEDLGDELRRMERQRVEIDVDGDEVERAASDVLALQAELDEFSAEQFRIDMELDLEESQARLRELADQLQELEEFDMPGVRAGVLSEFEEVQQRVQGLEQDLEDLGQPHSINVTGGEGIERIADGAGRAEGGMQRLGRSSDQTRSVMANLTGNAAQDLAEMGGVAGSAGIALSQLAEYAADGNVSLKNFAGLVGPMLAVSAGVTIATKAWGDFQKRQQEVTKNTAEATAELLELTGVAGRLEEALTGVTDNAADFGDFLLGSLANTNDEFTSVLAAATQLGVELEDVGDIISGLGDKGDLGAFALLVDRIQESLGITRDQAVGVAEALGQAANPDQWSSLVTKIEQTTDLTTEQAWALRDQLELWGEIGQVAKDTDINDEAEKYLTTLMATTDGLQLVLDARERLADRGIFDPSDIQVATEIGTAVADVAPSLDELNDALRRLNAEGLEPAVRFGDDWATVVADMADGTIDTVEAQEALNRIMEELGTTDADVAIKYVADALAEQEDAARSAEEATADWIRANREFDPNDLRWALVADGANKLREGVELTATQVEALQGLVEQYGLSETDVLDEGLRMWEEHQQAAEEALQAEADAVEDAIGGLQEHAAAIVESAQAFVEMQGAVDDVARSLDTVADRGGAMSGVLADLGRIGELGQSQELIGFVGGLQGVVEAIDELSRSDLEGLDLVPDTWDEVLNMPEELGPVVQALGSFAGDVQREMSQAFEAGGDAGVREWAENTRTAITEALLGAADLTEDQVNEILGALGLLPDQIEMAIVVSNQERATSVIESMASVIAGLPAETQLRIAAVADTDPIAALQLTIDALAAQGYEIPVELVALVDELDGEVEGHVPPPVTVGVEGDMLPITKAVDDFTAEEKSVTVRADADTDAAETDLGKTVEPRTAPIDINIVQYVIALALMAAVAAPRTANITANALTAEAGLELDNVADDRTAYIDAVLRHFPTHDEILNRITGGRGAIVVPVDTRIRYTARIDGSRVPG